MLSLNSKDITSFLEPQGDKVRKPCIVPSCQALIAPSMWKTHLEGHVRGAYAGVVPDLWLTEHNLLICCHCSSLVAMSHKASHSEKCNPLQNPSLSTVPRSTPDAVSDAIPSLSDVCELRCSTIRFIPTKAKPAFARALSSALRAVVSDNSVESGSKLFLLPKCVLPSSKRGGRHNKPVPIDVLCQMWLDGHLGDLWKLAASRATSSTHVHQKEVPVRKKLTSAISLAQDGLYGKACQTLTSSGVAPNNPTTWNLLVSKHPSCTCPSVPDTPHTDFKLPSTFNLMAILRSFPKLTAARPSGLRIQHLIDAAEVPLQTPVLHSLRAVIDLLVSGRAPAEVAVFLAGGNLTALNMPREISDQSLLENQSAA